MDNVVNSGKIIFNLIAGGMGAIVSFIFGDSNTFLSILLGMCILDFVTGMLASWHEGTLSSKKGYKGIAKKVGYFLLIAIAHLIDVVTGAGGTLEIAVTIACIANEAISGIENLGRMGIPLPKKLLDAIEILKPKGENK